MSQYGHFLQEQKRADKYLGQRNQLLAAAKSVVRHANQREPHLRDLGYAPHIRELQLAIARCEEKP